MRIDRVGEFECPVLGLFGGADQGIPATDVEAFGKALAEAGIDNEMKIYDGAPHSFFDRAQEQYAEESADAWRKVLAFIERYS